MSLNERQRRELIAYRIEQAKDAVQDVELLLANERLHPAMNRIYYGMFYMLLALGLQHRFETSKHAQLLGWFNKTFMKDEVLPRKYGHILRDAFRDRMNSDYEAFVTLKKEQVVAQFEQMKEFISIIEEHILSNVQRYKEIEHTADLGVEIYGATLEELFQNAGYALFDTIADITTVEPTVERSISVSGDDTESLMFNWLRELLYLFSVHEELYGEFEIHSLQPTAIEACIRGEQLDLEKHRFETEIKAITYHQFEVSQHEKSWQARVVFDV